ncbi:MAG TPA: DUF5658 family protein [Oligoflexia bacterium]|nr:DUF5658 family protein [Oligoflexia bacterium]
MSIGVSSGLPSVYLVKQYSGQLRCEDGKALGPLWWIELRLVVLMEWVLSGAVGAGRGEEFSNYSHLIPGRKALLIGSVLCLFQLLDGLLTSIGVSRFGLEIEGNPWVRFLMQEYGCITALGTVKLFAVAVVIFLTFFTNRIPWLNSAMGALSCAYLLMAILPWTYILFVQPLFV